MDRTFLKSAYGIDAVSIMPAMGGFSAKAAYRVTGANGIDYFVKAYDAALPTTRVFIERIESCMLVLDRLSASRALCRHILQPVASLQGRYKAETDGLVYVVFRFVHGETPGIEGMTRAQTAELAGILAALHDTDVPFEAQGLAEDVSLSFCERLARYLGEAAAKHAELFALLHPHADMLRAAIREALRLRNTHRVGYAPLVLCHGDAHGNNVMQGERLVLADWEDLRLAPAEADLFIHAWHPYGDTLLAAYAAARGGYHINRALLYFYTLRRRIEDVWVDVQRLTEEAPSDAEAKQLLAWIKQGIMEVQKLFESKTN
ncbi:MAG: aminoglycoside phosphotransferase family protein [Clostridiales bacterium]|nr:aminoglycoside phosphotransferase family protein [Clostridiales bacterium]